MLKITKNQGSIQVTADKSGFYPFDGTITFPTNSLFTATSANTDMITFKSTSNGDVQFVGNYKDITISGRSYDTKQKFLTAFSNLANQGSVDAYTKAETDAKLNDKLTAQTNANGALFISSSSNDDANSSVALYNSTVKGSKDVAIGFASTSSKEGMHNLAMLYNAQASGSQNIAIGAYRRCNGLNNIGIGCGKTLTVDVLGSGNVCIGDNSQAHTDNNNAVNESIAIGSTAKASNDYCTVIGPNASSYGSHVVAIGKDAHADSVASWSVAVGDSARAHGERSVALGYLSYATNETPLDICCGKTADNSPLRVIQSDANGKISLLKGDGTDERMVIQDEIEALKNAGGGTVDAYTKAETDTKLDAKQDKLTAGSGITITKDETAGKTFVGTKLTMGRGPFNDDGIRIGRIARVEMSPGIAFGDESISKNSGIAIGYKAKSLGMSSIVIGKNSSDQDGAAIGTSVGSGVVIGDDARGSGAGVVIGTGTHAGGVGVVIGYNSTVDGNGYGYAIGDNVHISETTEMVPIAIGYGAVADETKPLAVTILKRTGTDSEGNPELKYCDFIQGDTNGKISLLKGDGTDERMVIQDEIAALKNAGGGGGSVDAYTKAETDTKLDAKQDKLTAGSGITITKDETAGTSTIATAVSLTDNGNGAYQVGDSIEIGNGIAIGKYAYSFGSHGVAVGSDAHASAEEAVAIGHYSVANKDNPLVIRAGYKIVGNSKKSLTVLQSDANGKISIIKGDDPDERIVISDEITALKAEITTLKAEIAALKGGASTGDTTGA